MKINEAFEGLLKNKDSVYQSKKGNYRSELSLCESGYFCLKTYDNHGIEIDSSLGCEGFNGNIRATDEWEVVRQPVDLMTAVNSGKRFKPESWIFGTDNEFRSLNDNLEMFSGRECVQRKILNGKWLIE